ncbi:hypothetical protein TNCV_683131 [Trichonephila clavipes]|nr:hypothetical protein TNCV_683131 [Trichonephila clavipes]
MHSNRSDGQESENESSVKNWKSKDENKKIDCNSRSSSPVHYKSSSTKSRRNKAHSDEPSPLRNKISNSKPKESMVVIAETCQITSTKESLGQRNQRSNSCSTDRIPSANDSKKQKKEQGKFETHNQRGCQQAQPSLV